MLPLIRTLCTLLLCSTNIILASAASTGISTPNPSTYVSVRSLDKYGHSEQLQNAMKAANLQGTLVVAARDAANNSTIFLSLLDTNSILPSPSSALVSKNPSMLCLINGNPSFSMVNSGTPVQRTAIICTGLKGDAHWLVERVRTYSHRVWNRYNTFVDASGVAYAVSKYMRRFWHYDEEEEWTPGLLAQDLTRKDQQNSWSRPLGVCAMIASPSLPCVFVVDPSGIIQKYSAFAMGRGSNDVLKKLGDAMDEPSSDGKGKGVGKDLQGRLIEAIKSSVPSTKQDRVILVEVLAETGVSRTVVPI